LVFARPNEPNYEVDCGSQRSVPSTLRACAGSTPDQVLIDRRNAIEKELESTAIIERKVMVPMRDAKRMQADV
jgi:hypothetical protein